MICILNLYEGIFKDAESSLSYFGDRRTDTRVDQKFQVWFNNECWFVNNYPLLKVLKEKLTYQHVFISYRESKPQVKFGM